MKQSLKNMEKQIAKLEKGFHPVHDPKIIVPEPLSDAARKKVKPNERIVEDYYQEPDGRTVIWKERITADPSDMGKDFPHGSWDRRILDAHYRRPGQITRIVCERKTRAVIPATQSLKIEESSLR
jgi:hypothetical protein